MAIQSLFATPLYRARLTAAKAKTLNAALAKAARIIAADDAGGLRWARENGYPGYTSYASLDDLAWRDPAFGELQAVLDRHAAQFVRTLSFELGGRKIALDSLWVNVMDPGGAHTGHIHPHSVLSGTYYVSVPTGSGALKLEDPRLPLMMAAPPRKARAPLALRPFVYVEPKAGLILMWESWLRHEVMPSTAKAPRISVSFNYGWR
jgi:uncharacterized protein (TIGR02466 family)